MSDTYEPGQPVYVSATFLATSTALPTHYIVRLPEGQTMFVPLSSLSAAPTPQQIADLRESIDQIEPTGPDGSP